MGNMNSVTESFCTVPNAPFEDGRWYEMTAQEKILWIALEYLYNRYSKNELELSNTELENLCGLSARDIKKGRDGLISRRLSKVKQITRDGHSRLVYCKVNTKTGEQVPTFREQQQLLAIRREIDKDDFLSGDSVDDAVRDYVSKNPGANGLLNLSVYALPPEFYVKLYSPFSKGKLRPASAKGWVSMLCPFHDDHHTSFGFILESGSWHCFACGRSGNVVQFIQCAYNCDWSTAIDKISAALGINLGKRNKCSFVELFSKSVQYDYRNKYGNVVYTVCRTPDKSFPVFHRENGRLKTGFGKNRPILFNLPELTAARTVIVTEGEGKALAVAALNLRDSAGLPIAVTTNVSGACKWRKEYSPYLRGKRVVLLADNDQAGRDHVEQVRKAIEPYDTQIRTVHFPELPEHGDVKNYLEAHSAGDLIERMGADWFQLPDNGRDANGTVDHVSQLATQAFLDYCNSLDGSNTQALTGIKA